MKARATVIEFSPPFTSLTLFQQSGMSSHTQCIIFISLNKNLIHFFSPPAFSRLIYPDPYDTNLIEKSQEKHISM